MRRMMTLGAVVGLALSACGSDADGGLAGSATTSLAATTTTTSASSASTTATTPAATAVRTSQCETVGFTPNSEDAASDIRATGLSCAEAEAFVRVVGPRTSSGGPAELDVEGYHCIRVRADEDPLPLAFYECTNGTRKVTFVRS
ncbi:MAG: hypothetical protein ACRD0Q_09865 [Acidimicrobiales bacterium]